MQYLADITGIDVERPKIIETTALGVAVLAGYKTGWFKDLDEIDTVWQLDHKFSSALGQNDRKTLMEGWNQAVKRTLSTFK